MFSSRLFVATLSVFVFGCGPTSPAQKELGRQTLSVLVAADRVETFRLDGMQEGEATVPPLGDLKMGGFPVTARGKDQGAAFGSRLAAAVTDERNYAGDRVACFWPGVGFRVWKGEESIEVLICFTCGNFSCGPPTHHPKDKGTFIKEPAVRVAFVRLAKEAFPDDKEIQELKE